MQIHMAADSGPPHHSFLPSISELTAFQHVVVVVVFKSLDVVDVQVKYALCLVGSAAGTR